jgi:hypothetical protein
MGGRRNRSWSQPTKKRANLNFSNNSRAAVITDSVGQPLGTVTAPFIVTSEIKNYTGVISAVWNGTNGSIRITEITNG